MCCGDSIFGGMMNVVDTDLRSLAAHVEMVASQKVRRTWP